MQSLERTGKTCILLQTHKLDKDYLKEFYRIFLECKDLFDIYIIYDDTKKDFSEVKIDYPIPHFIFDINELASRYKLNAFKKPWAVTPGNAIFPLFDFSTLHHYSYYWMIEYDVRYTGSWRDFFSYFESKSESDLLGTTLTTFKERNDWNWWSSLKPPRLTYLKASDKIRGFFPVVRLSSIAIRALIKANKKGWSGHYEAVLPTVLHRSGLSIEDIGGDGKFVSSENRNRFYYNNPLKKGLSPGTFVCPPSKPTEETIANKLYHKVIG